CSSPPKGCACCRNSSVDSKTKPTSAFREITVCRGLFNLQILTITGEHLMRRTLALTLFALIVAANAFALGEARIQGHVIDAATKKPIPNAKIQIESTGGRNVKQEYKADGKGEYRFLVLDGTLTYNFTYSADGYQPYIEKMKLKLGDINTKDVELQPAAAAAAKATATAKGDPAVEAYNDGAGLANDGKNDEPIAKIEEAASQKGDFTAAYTALARLYLRTKNYQKAIENANKAMAITGDDEDMFSVLVDAYTALGQKDKAAEYKKKLPADASQLFNEAARLINEGKDNQ